MTQEKNYPFVSVVIISRDRHQMLESVVRSLLALDYPSDKYEIVVVEEDDQPQEIKGVKYIFLPRKNKGLGFARNIGVKHSSGDIIAFTDDDCIVSNQWLKEIVSTFQAYNVGGVAGTTRAQKGNLIGQCEEILGFPGGGLRRFVKANGKIIETELLSGCNCAYKQEVFNFTRFKEESYGKLGGDDYVLGREVSSKFGCVYNPRAIVYHKPRNSLKKIIIWFIRRRINELLYRSERESRIHALFIPLHQFMVIRTFVVITIPLIFGIKGLVIDFGLFCVYYAYNVMAYKSQYKYLKNRKCILLLPIVKLFMYIGVLLGDLKFILSGKNKLDNLLGEYNR